MKDNLSGIGEFALIERFRKTIRTDRSVACGSGDDCAVISFNKDNYLLFTCDMLVEGVDFLAKEDPYLIGRKSIAVSLSDIAACAGVPRWCVIAAGIPRRASLKYIDRLFKGMSDTAQKYKLNIAGGDLSRADKLVIDVSMLGLVKKNKLVLRNGAKPGDIIFTSGPLGGSIRGKHLKFIPRLKEAQLLTGNFKINSMIDISDGLAQDLGHILKKSKAGAVIYEEMVPLSRQARGIKDALYSGEDFELLFTLSAGQAKKLLLKYKRIFYPIGRVMPQRFGLRLVDKKGREKKIAPGGYSHF